MNQIVQGHDILVLDKSIIWRIPNNAIDIFIPDHIHDKIDSTLIVLLISPNVSKYLKVSNIDPRQNPNLIISLFDVFNILFVKQMLIFPNDFIIPYNKLIPTWTDI